MEFTDLQLREIERQLETWEGRVNHAYLCTRGLVTIGVGCMLPRAVSLAPLPLMWTDGTITRPATTGEKVAEWERVHAMRPGLRHPKYIADPPAPRLYLEDADISRLTFQRLRRDFLPKLAQMCPGFAGFPPGPQAVLIDLAWNLGIGGLAKWTKLLQACNEGQFDVAAGECSVKAATPESAQPTSWHERRNRWRRIQMASSVLHA